MIKYPSECFHDSKNKCINAASRLKSTAYPGEQGVQTMDLLPFSYISVILCDTLQCQLFHEIDLIWFLQV